MPDIYTKITDAAPAILEGLMTVLELRAADPQQRAMLDMYLADAAIPQGGRVLEVCCGTGAVTRVLRSGGCLAVFDGDYASGTLATGAGDPLEACAEAFPAHFIHDPWLVRRLPRLMQTVGVQLQCVRSYGYVEAPAPGLMLPGWVDLGADALVAAGRMGADMAAALKAKARRRVASGEYFGHIA